jgi:hypothetical protein
MHARNNRTTGLRNPFLGNGLVNTFQHATIQVVVFSMWSAPRNSTELRFLYGLRHATVQSCVFCEWPMPRGYKIERSSVQNAHPRTRSFIPCGGGTEYFNHNPASRRRRQKGKSRMWESKIWSRVPWDSDPRMTALAGASSNYKRQTRRPSDRALHINKLAADSNKNLVVSPRWVLY